MGQLKIILSPSSRIYIDKKMDHSRVIVLVWEAGQKEKDSGRKRARAFKLKSREMQCRNVTQGVPRVLHQTQGTNVGIESVTRVRAWRPGRAKRR